MKIRRAFSSKTESIQKHSMRASITCFGGKEIEISNLEQPIVCSRCALETLLADKAIADRVAVVEVGDEELALHYVNGKFSSVLRHGKIRLLVCRRSARIQNRRHFNACGGRISSRYIFSKIPQIYYTKIEVAEYQKARLYFNPEA